MATQDDYIRTALRVPPALHAEIHAAAKENSRTFNAEIVARLQASFDPDTARHTSLAKGEIGAVLTVLERAVKHAESLAKRLETIEKKRS